MAEIELNAGNFDGIIKGSDLPVLVDFWAPWCGPCRMLAPTVAAVADKYGDKVKVCKVNVDEEPDLARRFEIMYIPTLIVFRNGQPVRQSNGLVREDEILKMLEI
ncbi:MAG: thioredoxin [Clostridia bacterium]|nr:thioredoxin [Clostridia bacterium]